MVLCFSCKTRGTSQIKALSTRFLPSNHKMWFIFFLTLQVFFLYLDMGENSLYLCFSSLPHCHWQSFADFAALACFCHEHLFPFKQPDTRSIFRCLWGSFFQCNTSWQISVGVSETSPVSLCFIIPYSFNHCKFLRVCYSWMRFFINIIQPCKIVYVYFFIKMPVIKEKTFTLETTYLAQKASMATVYMENVNSFIPLRRLPAGKSCLPPKCAWNCCKA